MPNPLTIHYQFTTNMSVNRRLENDMDEPDLDVPSAADLAAIEAELPEWDRLRVRDHWEAVIAEELDSPEPADELAEPEPTPLRHRRRTDATVLRLVTAEYESARHDEEAA